MGSVMLRIEITSREQFISLKDAGQRDFSKHEFPDGLDFSDLDLDGFDFTDAFMPDANFTRCSLKGACFRSANIKCADFHRADLTGADLRDSLIDASEFVLATTDGMQIDGASFYGAILIQADVQKLTNPDA